MGRPRCLLLTLLEIWAWDLSLFPSSGFFSLQRYLHTQVLRTPILHEVSRQPESPLAPPQTTYSPASASGSLAKSYSVVTSGALPWRSVDSGVTVLQMPVIWSGGGDLRVEWEERKKKNKQTKLKVMLDSRC